MIVIKSLFANTVSCYLVTCNLLNSSLSVFNQCLFQVSLGGTSYGSLVQINNAQAQLIDIQPGSYNQITIQLYDQNYNALHIIDNEITMILLIDYVV